MLLALLFLPLIIAAGFLFMKGDIGPLDASMAQHVGEHDVTPAASNLSALKVLSWNIHYGHGSELDHFARHDAAEVRGTLGAIAAELRAANADIVLLQEVDRDADRSHREDQLARLAEQAGYPYSAFIYTWRARYIPFPGINPDRWLRRVHSGQGVLSRFPITSNHRIRLPQPAEQPFWYNLFYLHRSVQLTEVTPPGQPPIQLFNIHLEAFSVSNREEQAELLLKLIGERGRSDGRVVVAGDFNSVPAEAERRKVFPDEPETDFTADSTIALIRQGFDATDVLAQLTDEPAGFTFPSDAPNRRLDHAFIGRGWPAPTATVRPAPGVSDHLPVLVQLNRGRTAVKLSNPSQWRPTPSSKPRAVLKPGDITVDVRAPERLKRAAPVQEKSAPAAPARLNPPGWLEDAPAIAPKTGAESR
jgi:endonuclease/exonuclease/phosphatase family metal-dependent hydrolase